MIYFLASNTHTTYKKNGERFVRPMNDDLSKQLKKYLKKTRNILFVPSDFKNTHRNEKYSQHVYESLKKSNINFNELILLNNTNAYLLKDDDFLSKIDLIYIASGNPINQIEVLKALDFTDVLERCKSIVLAEAEGVINLGKEVYCMPHNRMDLKLEKYYEGLGVLNFLTIHNFSLDMDMIEVLIHDSKENEFYGITENAFMIVKGSKITSFGDVYKIKNEKIQKI